MVNIVANTGGGASASAAISALFLITVIPVGGRRYGLVARPATASTACHQFLIVGVHCVDAGVDVMGGAHEGDRPSLTKREGGTWIT